MKKFYLLHLLLFATVITANAAPYFWIGGSTGNWNSATNWSATSGGAAGTLVPGANDDVTFDNGLTIALTYDASGLSIGFKTFSIINSTQLTLNYNSVTTRTFGINNSSAGIYEVIQAGSSLTLKNAANGVFEFASITGRCVFNGDFKCIVTVANSSNGPRLNATSDTIEINGLAYTGDNGVNLTAGTSSNFNGSKFRWKNSGVFQLDRRAGSIPGGTFDPQSLIKITGANSAGPSSIGSSGVNGYGSLEWNCPNQTATANISVAANSIFQGNFKIINTGTAAFRPASTANITIAGDLLIDGGILSMGNSTTVSTWNINGKISQTGGTLDFQGSSAATTVKVKGEIKQLTGGVITETGSSTATTLELNGTTNQNITLLLTGITQDISLKINNAAGATTLTDITLSTSTNAKLTFTAGNLDMATNNKILFVQNPQSNAVVGGTATSHVIGRMKRNSTSIGGYSFPVSNNATDLKKAIVTTSAATATTWDVQFLSTNANSGSVPVTSNGDQIDVVSSYVWDIQRSVGGSDATNVTLSYAFTDNNVSLPANTKIVHWTGTAWESFGGTDGGGSIDNTKGTDGAIGTVISNFSPFTFGGALNVLPLSIQYLTGSKQGTNNFLDWKVNCTSAPSVVIELQRSADSRTFNTINQENATALRCQQSFNHTDASPLAGINYYRLKITDPSGTLKYSNIVAILNKDKGFELISLAPNPVKDQVILTLTSAKAGKIEISISDIAGKQTNTVISGSNPINMSFAKIAAGTYTIVATNADGEVKTTRFVKY
jgi:hypothetical protein